MTFPALPGLGENWKPWGDAIDPIVRSESRLLAGTPPKGIFKQGNTRPNGITSSGFVANRIYYIPIETFIGFTYTALGFRISTACTTAGAVAHLGIYNKNLDGSIGSRVIDAGTVTIDVNTGTRFATIAFTPTKNQYYAAVLFTSNTNLGLIASSTAALVTATGLYDDSGNCSGVMYQDTQPPLPLTPAVAAQHFAGPIPFIMYGVS